MHGLFFIVILCRYRKQKSSEILEFQSFFFFLTSAENNDKNKLYVGLSVGLFHLYRKQLNAFLIYYVKKFMSLIDEVNIRFILLKAKTRCHLFLF